MGCRSGARAANETWYRTALHSRRKRRSCVALAWLAATLPAVAQQPVIEDAPTLTIAAVGDMMLGTEYPDNRLPDDDGKGFLAAVTPWLAGADVAFGNLEGVLADGGEPGKKCSNPAACFRFRSPVRYADHFVAAGFDVLSLANNHARDFGEEGRTITMRVLTDAGILHSGRVGTFTSFEKNGMRIVLIAYAVTKNSNMMLDYLFAERTIRELDAAHDIVVVSFHGGAEGAEYTHVTFDEEEYYGEPRGDVVRFARLAVDAGADLVLGHGPHVVRAMERYNDRLIAYSLGNFATHFGISINGLAGVAPILVARLDREGRFVDGEIVSTVQQRPHGPVPDPAGRARRVIESLTREDFGESGLEFRADGALLPAERAPVARRTDFGPDDDPGEDGPKPCNENWFWLVESTVKRPDEAAIGPEPGTAAWQGAIMQRLGLNGLGPNGLGPNGLGPNGLGPNGLGPNGLGPNGLGPNGLGPNGLGPNGTESAASDPAALAWCEMIDRRVFGDVN